MQRSPSPSQHHLAAHAIFEACEPRRLMAGDVRTVDGTGNNLAHADWGSTGTSLLRLVAAAYGDGKSTPAGSARASARAISNAVATHVEDADVLSQKHLSAFSYLWGQFIDHDMSLTSTASPREALNIAVPTGDASFDPLGTGTQIIPLSRSEYTTDAKGVRQQLNDLTAYIDGSQVYGSDATRAAVLRTFVGGLMKTSDGNLLPYNTAGLANANDAHVFASSQLFLAGDVRANENSELTALQTLFVREHNRLAAQIAKASPAMTDEQIYQQARRLVIGEIQNITFNEYLPALLGQNALTRYGGYRPNVNVGISNEFSTAAFRLGHSQLANDVEFINNDGSEARDEMELADVFFNPSVVEQNGIDTMLKYVASSNAEEIDSQVVDSLRNFLFGAPGQGGLDLAALNIQRGRDHGLASYNDTRATLGLGRVTSFSQITSDVTLAAKLQSVYGTVDNVDLWVGGLAENHVAGSNLGATFQRIVVDQFTRLRDGDRFWFERDLSGRDLKQVRGTSLAAIVSANTTISNLQSNVFVFDVSISGRVTQSAPSPPPMGTRPPGGAAPNGGGVAGIAVQLLDDTGGVVDAAVTAADGTYRFTGVQLGDYVVRPLSTRVISPAQTTIDVTRGQQFANVNFRLAPNAPPPPTRSPSAVTFARKNSTLDLLNKDSTALL